MVSFLDVGQGDAILIQSPKGKRVLIDSGSSRQVLRSLSQELPFFEKEIEVLIGTHPDTDHIGGFPEVVRRYKTGVFIDPGVSSENSSFMELKKRISENKIPHIVARQGMIIDFKDGSYLRVLFPDRDVSGIDSNDASIIAQYIFGENCFLLTGDSPKKIEEYLVETFSQDLECEVLKVGHHGSQTSTSELFISKVMPKFSVISAGKDNRYGHPHLEVTETLKKFGSQILNTAESGTIRMRADGERLEVSFR